MDTTPFLEPECMHVLEYFDENNISINFDFCICGRYLVIKTPIDVKAFKQVCNKLGYPISVKDADSAFVVTDKERKSKKIGDLKEEEKLQPQVSQKKEILRL